MFLKNMKIFKLFGKMVGAGARARGGVEIFDNLELEPHKNRPAPHHWFLQLEMFILVSGG
jgi:hypothetical protein